MNYFCAQCKAILGSDDQPQSCKNEEAKWDLQKLFGGAGCDYFKDLDEWD
jgi:hypothetical protein